MIDTGQHSEHIETLRRYINAPREERPARSEPMAALDNLEEQYAACQEANVSLAALNLDYLKLEKELKEQLEAAQKIEAAARQNYQENFFPIPTSVGRDRLYDAIYGRSSRQTGAEP